MFSHIMIGSDDIDASKKFYDAVLGTIDVKPGYVAPDGRVFYMTPGGTLALTKPINGQPASGANGGTIGFACSSPDQVNAWHAAGVANGGTSCEDPPGERAGSGLYLGYLRDPAGNKLCGLHKPAK